MTVVLRSRRVATPDGVRPATVHVEGSRITRIGEWSDAPANATDAGDLVVMPGIVDTHVHCNEPGRTEWEGFATATRAAAAGGVTTLLDMPLNSIPATTTVVALEAKRRALASADTAGVNVEFIGGVVPGNEDQIAPLVHAGVRAFKAFMSPSGVDEFENDSVADLRRAFPILAQSKTPLMVHAEDPAALFDAPHSRRYADYLASRPAQAEHRAIESLVRLLEECATPVHVVHLSSAGSLPIIEGARSRGLPITVETCPHYLTFAAEEIPDGATEYKCAPPIRSREERERLWTALIDGRIDLVASDHSPCPPAMKQTGGDFAAAWGGIASLELGLAAVWTGARARNAPIERLVEWMCAGPARLAGLGDRKGRLAAGYDADIVVWDPEARFVVDPSRLKQRHPVTPYAGRELYGIVRHTYVGGMTVHDVQ